METLLNRYRNITVLLLAIFAQLILLAYQVKNADDVPMIRVWAVSAVTPLAKVLDVVRSGTVGLLQGYITLHDTHQENLRLREELGRQKIENQFLKNELNTADRAKALSAFQAQTQSKTLAARIIGLGAGFNSKVVFVDRGSVAGVAKGMGVVTPDGIVGKVLAAYPVSSLVELITDPNFAAGVISQKNHARGTLKGHGDADCKVDYVQNEQKVDVGEWFFTSGDDRIFPKGFPVGVAHLVGTGQGMKEISVEPSGLRHGLEEVLILLQGVHQEIPDSTVAVNEPVYMAPPPPGTAAAPAAGLQDDLNKAGLQTDADRLRERYQQIGQAQGHKFGEGTPGSKPPDFNIKLPPASATPVVKPEPPKPEAHPTNGQPFAPGTPAPGTPAPGPPAPGTPAPGTSAPQSKAPAATAHTPRPDTAPAQKKAAPAPPPTTPEPKPTKPSDPFL